MLVVDGLAGGSECVGDRLPRPAECAGVVRVPLFEFLDQLAQGRICRESDGRVAAVHRVVQGTDSSTLSPWVDNVVLNQADVLLLAPCSDRCRVGERFVSAMS
jgi:hypothetical protein